MKQIVVTTAVELSKDQLDRITQVVTKTYGKGTKVATRIDSDVIGGIQISVDSKLLDGSVRNKLEQIKQHIR